VVVECAQAVNALMYMQRAIRDGGIGGSTSSAAGMISGGGGGSGSRQGVERIQRELSNETQQPLLLAKVFHAKARNDATKKDWWSASRAQKVALNLLSQFLAPSDPRLTQERSLLSEYLTRAVESNKKGNAKEVTEVNATKVEESGGGSGYVENEGGGGSSSDTEQQGQGKELKQHETGVKKKNKGKKKR